MQTFRTIVITGSSSGIGATLARLFAGSNIHLGLIGRDITRLEIIANDCKELGATVDIASMDIQDVGQIVNWLSKFDDKHGIDLVIANAGITHSLTRTELHEPESEIVNVINTNFIGTMNTVMPVIDRMKIRRRGHIAVISSLAAWHGIPAFPAYSASKAALLNYFQAIRSRLAVAGIELTIICPGYIQTPMTESLSGMKFMVMPVDKAAMIIKRGIEKRKPLVVFPLSLRVGLWFLNLLPISLSTRILIKWFGIK